MPPFRKAESTRSTDEIDRMASRRRDRRDFVSQRLWSAAATGLRRSCFSCTPKSSQPHRRSELPVMAVPVIIVVAALAVSKSGENVVR